MTDRYAVITSLADVRMRKLRWLWAERIPTGVIAMLAGRGGEGKSTFGLWLAAQLTLGTLPGDDRDDIGRDALTPEARKLTRSR